MSIINTFVAVAEDCPTYTGIVPPLKTGRPSLARIQYDLLTEHPYEYDLDALNRAVHRRLYDLDRAQVNPDDCLSYPQQCLRASPLTKVYGWGAHYDWAGRIALYPADGIAYQKFMKDAGLKVERAERNRTFSPQSARHNPGLVPHVFQSVA